MNAKQKENQENVQIIPYKDEYKTDLKTLNYAWLEKYFKIEPSDIESLNNPKQEIIDKGGYIYFAKLNHEIVGCVALLKLTDDVYELGKMAVSDHAQGYGIGTKLLKHSIAEAKKLRLKKLILYSNTQLAPALHLYKKHGFIETAMETGLYDRANIKMEREINHG